MKSEDIKFKGKALNSGEWVEGDLLRRITDTCIVVKDMDDIVYYPVDPSTVCQFTGLKDCEGNVIWEGDILHDIDYDIKYIVIFAEGTFLAKEEGQCVGISLHECIGDSGNVTYAKVIGNKFDKKK